VVTFNEIQQWATLGSVVMATVAAAASTATFWRSLRANTDKIKVGFGSLNPPCEPGDSLYVVNQSDHSVQLRDYGFISATGMLLSVPDMLTHEPLDHEGVSVQGRSLLAKRGDVFEIGNIKIRDAKVGAFAMTAGRDRYAVGFDNAIPWHRRYWIWLKIWWMT
jgi:hypothetical protein